MSRSFLWLFFNLMQIFSLHVKTVGTDDIKDESEIFLKMLHSIDRIDLSAVVASPVAVTADEDDMTIRKRRPLQASQCRDVAPWCRILQEYCFHQVMRLYCTKTCQKCPKEPTTTGCYDRTTECIHYKRYCRVDKYANYMEKYCQKSCTFCDKCGVSAKRNHDNKPSLGVQNNDTVSTSTLPTTTKITSSLIQGKNTKRGYYPWQAAIYYGEDFQCGGSLIDQWHILTASHCVQALKSNVHLFTVVLGDHDRALDEGSEQTYKVQSIYTHPMYEPEASLHDIAIIKLTGLVAYTEFITPICLPSVDQVLDVGTKCYITGWGKTSLFNSGVNVLQELKLPIADRALCKRRNEFNNHVVTENMICAGYDDGKMFSSACHGDSGGPLQCEWKPGVWTLFGIVSWGSQQCSGLERYTVFTRVSKYIKWIQSDF